MKRQERCEFLSVFTLNVHLYLYHFVHLCLDSHTAPDLFFTCSYWLSLGKTDKEVDKRESARQRSCKDVVCQHRLLIGLAIPTAHSTQRFTGRVHIHINAQVLTDIHVCNLLSLDHLLQSNELLSPSQVRETKGVSKCRLWIFLGCQQIYSFMDAAFTVVLPYFIFAYMRVCFSLFPPF